MASSSSAAAPSSTTTTTATPSSNSGNRKRGTRDAKPKIKVVVRRLPNTLTEEAFLTAIEKWKEHYDGFYFVAGKLGRSSTRAYLNFKDPAQVFDFYEKFSVHAFVDNKGGEYRAVIEYAPYQKMPKGRRRQDQRRGPLETDPDFVKFVEQLNAPKEVRPSAEQQLEKRLAEEAAKPPTFTTPLIEDLRLKKLAKQKNRGESRSDRWKRNKDNDKKKEKKDPSAGGEKRNRERGRRRDERKRKDEKGESSSKTAVVMDKPIKILTRTAPSVANTAPSGTPTTTTTSTSVTATTTTTTPSERKERKERKDRRDRKPKKSDTSSAAGSTESRRGPSRGGTGGTWTATKKHLEQPTTTNQPSPL
eukprot:TRINITY_DN1599_c0_g1_i1.p1 TRINITY_DN1599_c0_g1~~TRINITY_DN1599_c0_g1_i1.p1  ORF type:complete len:380 (+),score=90.25 TRINITY_DN1599_c0_g1_i1:59-1141(+)